MKLLYVLLLTFALLNPVIGQVRFEHRCSDDTPRLGALAEPQRFSYVSDKDGGGYYEVISGKVAAYIICGKKIEIPIGDVVHINADLYKGSYEGHSGVWGETLIDFDGPGPEWATRVYILLDDLRKLSDEPDDSKRLFSYRVSAELGKQSEFHEREDSYFLPFLVVGLVLIAYLVIRNLGTGRSSSSGGPYTGYSPGFSPSSSTSSTSHYGDSTSEKKSAPIDPNEGYTVTGYDAYGPSERRSMFGLTTQRKNDFGHWEDV